ncbi:diadenosine tetraphosphatase [Actinobacillus equuli]|nr:diadenosine tetraphosphatase [Actinobacillus equuli]
MENQQADILISHEAPRPHPQGFAVINQLARKMGVRKIFHGHHHDNFDYKSINRNKACDILISVLEVYRILTATI